MPRGVRIEYPGALYHVMCRGDRREKIFQTEEDRALFLQTWGEASERAEFVTHAYVLMGNHYHFLLETPKPTLVAGMAWFQTTYTVRFNTRHRLAGHLFQGRYKSVIIDGSDGASFRRVGDYIHLNPARARQLDRDVPRLEAYESSSFPVYAGLASCPNWLKTERYSRALGFESLSPPESATAQRKRMSALVGEVLDARNKEFWQNEWAELRRGWCLGSPAFRREMRKRATWLLEERKPGSLLDSARTEEEEESALKLLQKGLEIVNLTLEEVRGMKTSDPRKEILAWLLKRRTPMRNTWIAERLQLGHSSRVCMLVRIVQAASECPLAELKAVINSAFED
jgi:putative transposase